MDSITRMITDRTGVHSVLLPLLMVIDNGNRTEWSPICSVIVRVIHSHSSSHSQSQSQSKSQSQLQSCSHNHSHSHSHSYRHAVTVTVSHNHSQSHSHSHSHCHSHSHSHSHSDSHSHCSHSNTALLNQDWFNKSTCNSVGWPLKFWAFQYKQFQDWGSTVTNRFIPDYCTQCIPKALFPRCQISNVN